MMEHEKTNGFEISLEEFERLEDLSKKPRPKILENVAEKIKKYDGCHKSRKYNSAYRRVLEARGGKHCLVDEEGNVSEKSLQVIEKALIDFEMGGHGQMDRGFKDRLKQKLEAGETKEVLKKFRNVQIYSPNLKEIKSDAEKLYNTLSVSGEDGLSARKDCFDVGATKIMNFLFPDLFVIVDKNVKKALHKSGPLNFKKYWDIMMICHEELDEWKKSHGTLGNLLELDSKPTTLTRIFDKCAFIMGKLKS